MSPKELLATYNDLAAKNGLPLVNRFATRLVGVTRVTRLLDKARVEAGEPLPQPRTRAEIPSEWPLLAPAPVPEFEVDIPPPEEWIDDSNPHAAVSEVLNGVPDEVFVVTEVAISSDVKVLEPETPPVRDPFGDKAERMNGIVQLGTVTADRTRTVQEIIDTLRVSPKPVRKAKEKAAPTQRVKGTSVAKGTTFASRTYELLVAGKSDEEIWRILQPEFGANNAYEGFAKWYRAHLAHAETRK